MAIGSNQPHVPGNCNPGHGRQCCPPTTSAARPGRLPLPPIPTGRCTRQPASVPPWPPPHRLARQPTACSPPGSSSATPSDRASRVAGDREAERPGCRPGDRTACRLHDRSTSQTTRLAASPRPAPHAHPGCSPLVPARTTTRDRSRHQPPASCPVRTARHGRDQDQRTADRRSTRESPRRWPARSSPARGSADPPDESVRESPQQNARTTSHH